MKWLTEDDDGCTVTLRATPRASRSELLGAEAEWLRVRLKAPPVDGKANSELVKFLARTFKVPRSAVAILSGDTARLKRVKIAGIGRAAIVAALPQEPDNA